MLSRSLAVCAAAAVAMVSAGCTGSPAAGIRLSPSATGFVTPSASQSPDVSSPTPDTSASATASTVPSVHFASRCASSQLTLTWGGRFSEPSGQHTLSLTLTNASRFGCHLFGYPGVSFVDPSGRILPFRYVWGGDQVVTSSKPGMVELLPGGAAYELVNKYRCDTTTLMQTAVVRLIPPDERTALQLSVADNVPMDYCGPGDPGSTVYVSPVEPAFTAAIAAN